MTILQKPLRSGDGHAARGWLWRWFGHGDQAVRYTEAWEHENFAEEQARWERSDPEYAQICEQVRRAKKRGGEASRRADEAKAQWDARVYTQRQANDDAQRAQHALKADQTARPRPATSRTSSQRRKNRPLKSTRTPRLVIHAGEGHHRIHASFATEANDSPAPGIMPEPVRVHDQPAATTASRGERQAPRLRFRGRPTRNPASNEPTKLEVEQWLPPKQPS
jgi:hypothetical protein